MNAVEVGRSRGALPRPISAALADPSIVRSVGIENQTRIRWIPACPVSYFAVVTDEPSTGRLGRMDTFLTVHEVAVILKVKPITVREMFREKRLRAFKVGKAWRTTERMLIEDVETLAKGDLPPDFHADGVIEAYLRDGRDGRDDRQAQFRF